VDTDGGIKAAIWGGSLAARHACVSGCKFERYYILLFSPPPISSLSFYISMAHNVLKRMDALEVFSKFIG
jgi:hypothetical protein